MTDLNLANILICLSCRSLLKYQDKAFRCASCDTTYATNDDGTIFITPVLDRKEYDEAESRGVNRLKSAIKRYPFLWTFLSYTIGTVMYAGLSAKKALRLSFQNDKKRDLYIINLGSGTRRYEQRIINIDIFPYKNVDIVADARMLPFPDNSIDMVISEFLLEHVPDPEHVVKEIARVVKSGGYIYIAVPFLHPYHASPDDFKRWTVSALQKDFSSFAPIKIGMRAGPVSALLGILMHFFATLFSFRSQKLYTILLYFFMALLAPLKIFDLLFYLFPQSVDAADLLYFWGQKK